MSDRKYDIAVVGATGVVGEVIMDILSQREFPIGDLYPLASERSAGDTISFNDKPLYVQDVAEFDFANVDIAFFSAGSEVSKKYVPIAAEQGCIVIDNTSEFRMDPTVPLVVPEVNADLLKDLPERQIIANPNCSTIQMVVALKAIYDEVGIDRINVATYQAVSGAGKKAIDELARQTADLLNGASLTTEVFPKQIAFNLFPGIDVMQSNGYTREEMKMVQETQKIFNDDRIKVNPTAVRVPVFYGHSEAIHIETTQHLSVETAAELLKSSLGVIYMEKDYPTPITDGSSQDAVYVGRLRQDISHPNGLCMWVVADNIRKGAALNAVQIAEMVINYQRLLH